ncbi:hypothetical protein [Streptomyces sp. B21-083]|uniref:hypothetical protein n=1 Tax=Streptomyces sp. B21-083 TaxID=3039410 RepID=UPI002FF43D8E
MDDLTRTLALTEARNAAAKAKRLAEHAESAAHSTSRQSDVKIFAAAGTTWADVARSYAAIAAALPETETTNG